LAGRQSCGTETCQRVVQVASSGHLLQHPISFHIYQSASHNLLQSRQRLQNDWSNNFHNMLAPNGEGQNKVRKHRMGCPRGSNMQECVSAPKVPPSHKNRASWCAKGTRQAFQGIKSTGKETVCWHRTVEVLGRGKNSPAWQCRLPHALFQHLIERSLVFEKNLDDNTPSPSGGAWGSGFLGPVQCWKAN
jgi:hypothetical protein